MIGSRIVADDWITNCCSRASQATSFTDPASDKGSGHPPASHVFVPLPVLFTRSPMKKLYSLPFSIISQRIYHCGVKISNISSSAQVTSRHYPA